MTMLDVHAVRTRQGGFDVYAFFIEGGRVLEIAEITRIGRGEADQIEGFQRPEIVAHVKAIADYLDRGDVLFPNAVILALGPGVTFQAKRGTKNQNADPVSTAGVLRIPARPGRKAAWVVDGQQRALAMAKSEGSVLPVPVVAFVSGDLAVHREQFILVNKARPLDRRLIDELLPTVGAVLPRDLASRRVPSTLCSVLNNTPGSPFHTLVRRPSGAPGVGVVTDTHLTNLMRRSLHDPRGALAQFVGSDGSADLHAMYRLVADYWSAVRDTFPEAWGLPPERSRLMHGAGLLAMGVLMDEIMTREGVYGYQGARTALSALVPHCHWTEGRWDALGRDWNELQNTARDIRALSNHLVVLERQLMRLEAA